MQLKFGVHYDGSVSFADCRVERAINAAERAAMYNRMTGSVFGDGWVKDHDLADALRERGRILTNPHIGDVKVWFGVRVAMSIPVFNHNGFQERDLEFRVVIPTDRIIGFGFTSAGNKTRGWHPMMPIGITSDDVRWNRHRDHEAYIEREYAGARAEAGLDEDDDLDWSPTVIEDDYLHDTVEHVISSELMRAAMDPSWVYRNAKGPLGNITDRTWDAFLERFPNERVERQTR